MFVLAWFSHGSRLVLAWFSHGPRLRFGLVSGCLSLVSVTVATAIPAENGRVWVRKSIACRVFREYFRGVCLIGPSGGKNVQPPTLTVLVLLANSFSILLCGYVIGTSRSALPRIGSFMGAALTDRFFSMAIE